MSDEREPMQPGIDAIDAAMQALYPDQPGHYYGTVVPYMLGVGIHWICWEPGKVSAASPIGTMLPMASANCMKKRPTTPL